MTRAMATLDDKGAENVVNTTVELEEDGGNEGARGGLGDHSGRTGHRNGGPEDGQDAHAIPIEAVKMVTRAAAEGGQNAEL